MEIHEIKIKETKDGFVIYTDPYTDLVEFGYNQLPW